MFSPDLFEKIFYHLEHFVENKKDGNHFIYGLVDRVE